MISRRFGFGKSELFLELKVGDCFPLRYTSGVLREGVSPRNAVERDDGSRKIVPVIVI